MADPTPTPPEGWEELIEWGVRFVLSDGVWPVTDEATARQHTGQHPPMTRRVWYEPWREAE